MSRTMRFVIAGKRIPAVLVMLAVLFPTAAPIPLWAYDLNLPPMIDDGLRLTAPGASFESSIRDLVSSLTSGPAALFRASGSNEKEIEVGYSVAALEKRVAGIKTEAADREELKVGQKISLAARPVDKKGGIVNGLAAKW